MALRKIYTFGDGYASGHIWPEWPQLLEALCPEIEFSHHGQVGAGNEFIANAVVQAHLADPTAYFIVQWTNANRFDKLLQDDSWQQLIADDPVYWFNTVTDFDQTWWLSSESNTDDVKQYHSKFIQSDQHNLRTANLVYLIDSLIKDKSLSFSTYNIAEVLHQLPSNYINCPLSMYSKLPRFSNVRQKEVQPSPIVHLSYLTELMLPCLPVDISSGCLDYLTKLVTLQEWCPYAPDRDEIWSNIKNQLMSFCAK